MEDFGFKPFVLKLLNHEEEEVGKAALECMQKLLIKNWEFLCACPCTPLLSPLAARSLLFCSFAPHNPFPLCGCSARVTDPDCQWDARREQHSWTHLCNQHRNTNEHTPARPGTESRKEEEEEKMTAQPDQAQHDSMKNTKTFSLSPQLDFSFPQFDLSFFQFLSLSPHSSTPSY